MLIKSQETREDLIDMITNYLEINDFPEKRNEDELTCLLALLVNANIQVCNISIVVVD